MKIKDFVSVYKNKANNQIKLEVKKNKLKEFDTELNDILNSPLLKKIKKFREI
jgi:hypothetical protein